MPQEYRSRPTFRALYDRTIGKCCQTSSLSLTGVAIEKQGIANFDRHAPAYANLLAFLLHSHRDRIFVGGQRRGACRLSPELHRTGQPSVQLTVKLV